MAEEAVVVVEVAEEGAVDLGLVRDPGKDRSRKNIPTCCMILEPSQTGAAPPIPRFALSSYCPSASAIAR